MNEHAGVAAPPAPRALSAALLEVHDISVAYGDVQVLSDITLAVRRGECVAVIGSNGAGKTTLLQTIAGLLRPLRGEVVLEQRSIGGLPAHAICERGLALVPEGGQVFTEMTVLENLQVGAHRPRARASLRQNLTRVWELFPRLKERARQLAGTLSGGERQMLAISRALMSDPALLMLDEPSLAVAPVLVEQIFDTVANLRREGLTVLLVEQNVLEALQIADRAYVLETGHIVREGAAHILLRDPDIRRHFLGI